jgi:hypothetical protein
MTFGRAAICYAVGVSKQDGVNVIEGSVQVRQEDYERTGIG